jgi:hypothetical protein
MWRGRFNSGSVTPGPTGLVLDFRSTPINRRRWVSQPRLYLAIPEKHPPGHCPKSHWFEPGTE